ncbi:MAG: LysR family transcriptional regulator [Verrucomicrobiae bacterium]|nr:LysR family transcriptional regulator [Verrucomicrobiae bacterium]
MNVHHLELFYYVAKHEGITEAVRKMPYGIQQPAVSGQILQLENYLGVKLFQRRPFALTPAGEELYDFIHPFFSRIEQITARLRGEEKAHLRLAASAAALSNHLPEVLQALQREVPGLRLTLRELTNPELEAALRKQEADVALAVLHRKIGPGIQSVKLLDLPLALAVPTSCTVDSFEALAATAGGGQLLHPLIGLPKAEPVAQLFQRGLLASGLKWEPSMEVSELGLILHYVAKGFGFGVAVDIPGVAWPAGVKKIRLPGDFPPLTLGALHTGELKSVAARFLELVREQAGILKKALRKSGGSGER